MLAPQNLGALNAILRSVASPTIPSPLRAGFFMESAMDFHSMDLHFQWDSISRCGRYHRQARRRDAFVIGVYILQAAGVTGPLEDPPPTSRIDVPAPHHWPPSGVLLRTEAVHHPILGIQYIPPAEAAEVRRSLLGLASRDDDALFDETAAKSPSQDLQLFGVCMEPAILQTDAVTLLPDDKIEPGDFVLVHPRGALAPALKVFTGLVERDGERYALLFLNNPSRHIEVRLDDIITAIKVKPPRRITGNDLLAGADPSQRFWFERYGVPGNLPRPSLDRKAAWVASVKIVVAWLRTLP